MIFVIFPVVHQPSNWESCDDEDSWRSECSRREEGATGLTERGVVVLVVGSVWLMGVATLVGRVSSEEAGVAKLLPGIAEELKAVTTRGVAVVVVVVAAIAVRLVDATQTVGEAEGTKGLASALSVDMVTCADGPVDREEPD